MKFRSYLVYWGSKIVGPVWYEKLMMFRLLGYWPNLDNPKTFNEKVACRKLFKLVPDAVVVADKFAMREVVERKLGKAYLPKLYAVYQSPSDIEFDKLPERCVIKTNNGSGGVILMDGRTKISKQEIITKLQREWTKKVGDRTNEYWYNEMKPCVIVEEYPDNGSDDVPPDYKFFVYHGKAKFIQHDHERFIRHTIRYYTEKWKPLDVKISFPLAPIIEKPANFDEMIKVAEKLAKGYDFIRIDLYSLKSRIYVGEITLAPNAGWERFEKYEDDVLFGKHW